MLARNVAPYLLVLSAACTGDPQGADTDTDHGSTGGTDTVATTIPLPSTSTDATTDGTDGSTGTPTSTASSTEGSEESTSNDTAVDTSSSSTGSTTYGIGWCILAFPPSAAVQPDEAFTVYARVFAEGLTDQTGKNDPADVLVVEVGFGADGSDPAVDRWTWVEAAPNPGYGPDAPNYSEVNDEYLGDVSIADAGIYDYAARVSGDSGDTWVYCDLDGLTEGGYTPDQAGDAAVGQ